MRLKVASRKSDLARWQSVQVARRLESLEEKPHTEFIFKASLGDQDLDTPLARMGSKGVFTEDFHADLTGHQCDLVVHSWKDLPVEERSDTHIAMTLPRADVRDLLVVPEATWTQALAEGHLRVLTSSPRRVYNLSACLPELLPGKLKLEFLNIRGNVPTRLAKMKEQNCALVLAKAGVDRLLGAESEGFLGGATSVRELLSECRLMVLPMSLNPGAAAQGALAVETLRDNEVVNGLCAKLNDEKTFACVQQEREILKAYGGGCHQKIGVTVLVREFGKVISLRGITDQGEVLQRWCVETSTPWSKARFLDNVFPVRTRDNSWFDRQAIELSEDIHTRPALFVARGEALPLGFKPSSKQLVWTAGVQTWHRLAKLGVWVHGCYDGLGDAVAPEVEALLGTVPWTKLSHMRGYTRPGSEMLATYQLIPKKNHPDIRGKTHFFWMSSTSFERARQLFPSEVNNGFNAAGPGSTFDYLRRVPDLVHPPKVFAGLEQFLSETLPK